MLKMKRKIRRRLDFGGLHLVKFSHVKQADRQCWYSMVQGAFLVQARREFRHGISGGNSQRVQIEGKNDGE